MYSKEELQRGLKTKIIGKKLFTFDTIDSTNACAKTLAAAGTEEGAVVVSDFQTKGRGRQGRSWFTEPGTNLLLSCILRPCISMEQVGLLTIFASVSVGRALQAVTSTVVECKWPNDLLINKKKCCGILVENSINKQSLEYAVVGIGINVKQKSFPQEIKGRATSLALEFGTEFDRREIFQKVLEELDVLYSDVGKGNFEPVINEWNARCTMFGRKITVTQAETKISGTALRLSDDGGLVIDTVEGKKTIYAGDVTVIV